MTEVKKMLNKKRIDLGITQTQMANKLGISPAYLSAIENGERKFTKEIYSKFIQTFKFSDDEKEIMSNRVFADLGEEYIFFVERIKHLQQLCNKYRKLYEEKFNKVLELAEVNHKQAEQIKILEEKLHNNKD